jgi:hypothetical protein
MGEKQDGVLGKIFHCRSAGKSNKILCLYKRLEKYKGDILRVFEKGYL